MASLVLPNIRKLFLPDPGFTLIDIDLERADAQVVAWEADDPELKAIFRSGEDVHLANARSIWPGRPIDKHSPERKLAKAAVHATNYGTGANTLAKAIEAPVKEAQAFIDLWFKAHPAIKGWHQRTTHEMEHRKYVKNAFGFKKWFMGRPDLPQALAWQAQSVVANVINMGLERIDRTLPDVQLLIQVHDSLVMQVRTTEVRDLLPEIKKALVVEVPYDDPLIIGTSTQLSDTSWGDVMDEFDYFKEAA